MRSVLRMMFAINLGPFVFAWCSWITSIDFDVAKFGFLAFAIPIANFLGIILLVWIRSKKKMNKKRRKSYGN